MTHDDNITLLCLYKKIIWMTTCRVRINMQIVNFYENIIMNEENNNEDKSLMKLSEKSCYDKLNQD